MPKTTSSILFTVGAQGWKFLITMASAMILGRLLLPSDFGLMATLGPLIGLADLIRDAGFSQAIVQRRDLEKAQVDGLFGLMLIISVCIGLIFATLSHPLAHYFRDDRLIALIFASCFAMQISTLASQPMALLNRELKFGTIAIIDCVASTFGLIIGVTIAVTTRSYWAIYATTLATTFGTASLAILFSKWRPGFGRLSRDVLQMAAFGGNIGLSNVANFLSRNADNILIARLDGPSQLGLYDRSYKLMLMPLTQITWPIARVMTPVLSRLQGDGEAYRKTYVRMLTLMATVSQPAIIVTVIASTEVVSLLLGHSWAAAGPIFAWLAAAAVHQVVTSSHGWLYLSQGRGRDYVVVGLFGSITTVTAFLIGIRWGAVGVAAAYTLSDYFLRLPFSWLWVGRSGPIDTRTALTAFAPHVLASIGCGTVVLALKRLVGHFSLFQIIEAVALSYAIYVAILFAFPEKRITLLHEIVKVRNYVQSRLKA